MCQGFSRKWGKDENREGADLDQERPGDLLRSLDLILKAVRSYQWGAIFNKRVVQSGRWFRESIPVYSGRSGLQKTG